MRHTTNSALDIAFHHTPRIDNQVRPRSSGFMGIFNPFSQFVLGRWITIVSGIAIVAVVDPVVLKTRGGRNAPLP